MDEAYCDVCSKMVKIEIRTKVEAHFVQGMVIRCDTENAYCINCHSQVYMADLQDRNRDKIMSEYKKKVR